MATDSYGQGITIPALTDPPNINTSALAMDDLTGQTVLRFSSASVRNATLVGAIAPVPGQIVYLTAEDRYEGRMNDGTWRTISSGPWVPIAFAAGYAAKTGNPAYRITGDIVELRGTMERSPASPFVKGAAFTIATLPVAARPSASRYFAAATEFISFDVVARVEVAASGAVSVIVPPSSGTAASWLSLDSCRYSLA
ncbi:hypothetical protein [Streptomyces filamentosus]|uniref:hypothetical protein n=1 Tax=Streptomyces filamentosus TaxID=67294 RepID=UPI00123ABE41|nr:hypothetical protein [Streptomyces filamentosus]KAA6216381.1 hypothetical protein CP979_05055 [Streptomyces filamentosus]